MKILTRLVDLRNNQKPPLQDWCHEKENGAHAKHDSYGERINLQKIQPNQKISKQD